MPPGAFHYNMHLSTFSIQSCSIFCQEVESSLCYIIAPYYIYPVVLALQRFHMHPDQQQFLAAVRSLYIIVEDLYCAYSCIHRNGGGGGDDFSESKHYNKEGNCTQHHNRLSACVYQT